MRKFQLQVFRLSNSKKILKRFKTVKRKELKTETSSKASWTESCPINTVSIRTGNVYGSISTIWMTRAAPLPCLSPCSRHTQLRRVTERLGTTLERRTFHQSSRFWAWVYKDLCNMESRCIIPLLMKQSIEACQSVQLNLNSSSLITSLEQLATGHSSAVPPSHFLSPLNSSPRSTKTKKKRRITKLLWKYSYLLKIAQKHT